MSLSSHALSIPLRQGLSLNLGNEGLVFCWLGGSVQAPAILLLLPLRTEAAGLHRMASFFLGAGIQTPVLIIAHQALLATETSPAL